MRRVLERRTARIPGRESIRHFIESFRLSRHDHQVQIVELVPQLAIDRAESAPPRPARWSRRPRVCSPGGRLSAAASSSCPSRCSAIWAVSNFIVPVMFQVFRRELPARQTAPHRSRPARIRDEAREHRPTRGGRAIFLAETPRGDTAVDEQHGDLRRAHRRMKFGQTSSSSRATTFGRMASRNRSTAAEKSSG